MKSRPGRYASIAATFGLIASVLCGCAVDGYSGYSYETYGADYYQPTGVSYGGWAPSYAVGPHAAAMRSGAVHFPTFRAHGVVGRVVGYWAVGPCMATKGKLIAQLMVEAAEERVTDVKTTFRRSERLQKSVSKGRWPLVGLGARPQTSLS